MQSLAQLRAQAALLVGAIALAIALAASFVFRSEGTPLHLRVAEILESAESLTIYVSVLLLFEFVLPLLVMMAVGFALPVRHMGAARVGLAACTIAIIVYVSYLVTWIRVILE